MSQKALFFILYVKDVNNLEKKSLFFAAFNIVQAS